MKILHILDLSVPDMCGYASRAYYIVKHQKMIGLEPVVLTSPKHISNRGHEIIDGINYYRTFPPQSSLISSLPILKDYELVRVVRKRILEVVKKENIDILHSHSPSLLGLAAIQTKRQTGCKVVYEIRAFWEDAAVASGKYTEYSLKYKNVRALEKYVCRHSDRVVTIAEGLKKDLVQRGIASDKVFTIPNGVDHKFFVSSPRDDKLYTKLGLNNKIVIGYIGTFFDFEGIEDMIHTMDDLGEENSNVVFLLVGAGEKEKQLRETIAEKKRSNIIYIGRVPHEEVLNYYSLIDIMVYPRKSIRVTELTTPLKPLEAMVLGKPVICSSVGGLIELVGHENGLFFSPGNMKELKDCCQRLIRDSSLREKIADKARNRVLMEKQWEKIVQRYTTVYDFCGK
ncbi:MAG: glycosyltransferase [Nitrospirota bacterium]